MSVLIHLINRDANSVVTGVFRFYFPSFSDTSYYSYEILMKYVSFVLVGGEPFLFSFFVSFSVFQCTGVAGGWACVRC